MPKKKTVLICLNGGTWGIINPLIKKDKLPGFEYMVKNGSYGNLKTIHPPASFDEKTEFAEEPLQWASIITGRKPKFHGIKGFSERLDSLKAKPLWEYFRNKKVGLLNWLSTWPPPRINGFVVPGWAPDSTTYPPSLSKELNQLRIKTEEVESIIDGMPEGFLKEIVRKKFYDLKRISVFYSYLQEKYEPEIYLIGIFGADHLQHIFWKYNFPEGFNLSKKDVRLYEKILPKFYIKFDEWILSKAIESYSNVFLISDHGFKSQIPATKFYFLKINKMLEKANLLSYKNGSIDFSKTKAYSQMEGIHVHRTYSNGKTTFTSEVRKIYICDKKFYEEVLNSLKSIKVSHFGSLFTIEKNLTVNVSVNLSIFEKISEKLDKININIKNNSYPFIDFCDIYEHSGEHSDEGIILVCGNGIMKGCRIENASILDILPTLLHLFKIQLPRNLDGRVLNIFTR